MQLELICEGGVIPPPTMCKDCGRIVPIRYKTTGPRVRGLLTPAGEFAHLEQAANANGLALTTVKSRCKRGKEGWGYSGKTYDNPRLTIDKRVQFCDDKCRDSWHGRNRDYEPRNERIAFALRLLKFMEKQFPEQTRKMREGFKRKEE